MVGGRRREGWGGFEDGKGWAGGVGVDRNGTERNGAGWRSGIAEIITEVECA